MIFFKKTEIRKKKMERRKTTEKQNKNQNEKLISVIVMGRFQERRQERFFFLRIKDGGVHPLKLSNLFVS